IPALVAGTCVVTLVPPGRPPVDVTVFAHASDFNGVVYDPRLLAGVDYVITSSAIRARFAADPLRYWGPCALYRLLGSTATVAARFASGRGVSGPALTIYRLPAGGLAPRPLGTWWWTENVPRAFRAQATALLAPGAPVPASPTLANGAPAPWVL